MSVLAEWVTAVGTVGAVAVAGFAVHRQSRENARALARAEHARVDEQAAADRRLRDEVARSERTIREERDLAAQERSREHTLGRLGLLADALGRYDRMHADATGPIEGAVLALPRDCAAILRWQFKFDLVGAPDAKLARYVQEIGRSVPRPVPTKLVLHELEWDLTRYSASPVLAWDLVDPSAFPTMPFDLTYG